MLQTTITIQRNKATMRGDLPVQIENMSYKMAADLGGQSPYDSYWISTTGGGIVDVQRGDLLIDENPTHIDPLTGNVKQYRVFGNPEQYFSVYARIPAEAFHGN